MANMKLPESLTEGIYLTIKKTSRIADAIANEPEWMVDMMGM